MSARSLLLQQQCGLGVSQQQPHSLTPLLKTCCCCCRSYDGPFTGKRELAGCGGGQPGIAQLEPLQQQQLAGTWVAAAAGSAAAAATGSSSSSHGRCVVFARMFGALERSV